MSPRSSWSFPGHEVWSRITYLCSPDTKKPLTLSNRSLKTPCGWTRPSSLKPGITGSSQAKGTRGEQLAPAQEHISIPRPMQQQILFQLSSFKEGGGMACTSMDQSG